ncbi:MAG: hypothetical protein U0235_19880 [Polyangiaceae bacterium]
MLKRAIVLSLGFVLACSGSPNDENDGDDGAELSSKACSGAACASLTAPKPLLRGGVAAVGSELYWIGLGPNGADGQPTDELQHCTLPACSSVTKLPLVLPNGKSLRATQLHALGGAGGVFFLGDEPGEFYDGFYTSDGARISSVRCAAARTSATTLRGRRRGAWPSTSPTSARTVGREARSRIALGMRASARAVHHGLGQQAQLHPRHRRHADARHRDARHRRLRV